MMRSPAWLGFLAALGAAACATASAPVAAPSPAEIPSLEARLASDPGDLDAGLRLAAAYREAGRSEDAAALTSRLEGEAPADPGVLIMTGLLAEDRGDFAGARIAYTTLLEREPSGALRARVEEMLEAARDEELRAEVRRALEQEGQLADTPPDPATVGIFPFVFEGGDAAWEPLALALPELLATDLGVTGRLTVVERVKIQTLLTELALASSGRVEPATAARGGRLLGAGHVVQGRYRVRDARIGVDAAVVAVDAPGSARVDPLTDEDAVEQLFDLEKRLALDIHADLGVQLTPAERERIDERQTESVQALLAFGRGLAASDAGDFTRAEAHFGEAAALDPSFTLARQRGERAALLAGVAARGALGQLSMLAHRLGLQRRAVQLLRDGPASIRQRVLRHLDARQRAILAEVLGQDRVGQATLLELIFRVPGSTP